MAIKINSWKPDTCNCILHYSWDDSVPQDQIITTFFAAEFVCEDHQHLVTDDDNNTTSMTVKENGLDIIKNVLDNNERRNKESLDKPHPKRNRGIGVARSAMITDEDRSVIVQQLAQHRKKVMQRYTVIFSQPNPVPQTVYNTVRDENSRKNQALKLIIEHPDTSDLICDVTDDGVGHTLKPNITFKYTWTGIAPDRVLNVEFEDTSRKTSTKIPITTTTVVNKKHQEMLDTEFGVGKVVIIS